MAQGDILSRLLGMLQPPPEAPAVTLPPGSENDDALTKAIAFIKGALTGNAQPGATWSGAGSVMGAAIPVTAGLRRAGPIVDAAASWMASLPKQSLADYKGRSLVTTMFDRTATDVSRGLHGGPGFATTPGAVAAEAAHATDSAGASSHLINAVNRAGGPEKTIVVPSIMGDAAHQSNRSVLSKMLDAVDESYAGKETTRKRMQAFNADLRSSVNKRGEKVMRNAPSILSDEFRDWALGQGFEGRRIIAEAARRRGIKDPLAALDTVLKDTTDPALLGVPAGSLGPTILELNGKRAMDPTVHPSYSHLVGGRPLGVMDPLPAHEVLQHAQNELMRTRGHGVTQYNLQRSITQPITSDLLEYLHRLGLLK